MELYQLMELKFRNLTESGVHEFGDVYNAAILENGEVYTAIVAALSPIYKDAKSNRDSGKVERIDSLIRKSRHLNDLPSNSTEYLELSTEVFEEFKSIVE